MVEFGLAHQAGGLFRRAAQDEFPSAAVEPVRKVFQGAQTRGIDWFNGPDDHDR
jgi:hypothetical protein